MSEQCNPDVGPSQTEARPASTIDLKELESYHGTGGIKSSTNSLKPTPSGLQSILIPGVLMHGYMGCDLLSVLGKLIWTGREVYTYSKFKRYIFIGKYYCSTKEDTRGHSNPLYMKTKHWRSQGIPQQGQLPFPQQAEQLSRYCFQLFLIK